MTTYPRNHWDPDFHGHVYLIEFLETNWKASTKPLKPRDEAETLAHEIPEVLDKIRDRTGDTLAKIQFENTTSFFSTLFPRRLMFTATSHPATFEVLRVGVLIGRVIVMYYKAEFNRVRPPQLSAKIDPVIDVPGHPSYPSGHATQSHLIAQLFRALHPAGNDEDWQKQIVDLANDIARRREIAGVHYSSDSAVGKALGEAICAILTDKQRCPLFNKLLDQARAEWKP